MEKEDIIRIVRVIAALTLLIGGMIYGENGLLGGYLIIAAYIIAGYDVIIDAVKGIFGGEIFDECFLMTVASLGAIFTHQYGEAAAVMIFFSIGELFEDIAVEKSRRSVEKLMDIRPDSACVMRGESTETVAPEEVGVGEVVVVRPGERIALDGVIESGRASLDCSALNGESMPRGVEEGDEVLSGCVSLDGMLHIRVSRPFGLSTVARVLEMAENAAERKAKAENFITRFSKIYTHVVCLLALLIAVVPPIFDSMWTGWISRALLCLVVSCPCALVVSVPLAFFGGIGGASRHGVLIKGADAIEALANAGTAVFDKTGTLTCGKFAVSAVNPTAGVERAELVRAVYAAEMLSDHPIARSAADAFRDECGNCVIPDITGFTEYPGMGIEARSGDGVLLVGSARLMKEHGIAADEVNCAGSVLYAADNGRYLGYIVISDLPREDTAAVISSLRRYGIERTVMLTGDNEVTAMAIAAETGVNEVHAALLPDAKVEMLEKIISSSDRSVIYVGDGINDAPVLARADVGIAMGMGGSDAAVECADVVLMSEGIGGLREAMRVSRLTMRIVRENIVVSIAVKIAVILLGTLGTANMWMAVFADVGVLILAILNSLRTLIK